MRSLTQRSKLNTPAHGRLSRPSHGERNEDSGILFSKEDMEGYLNSLAEKGRVKGTLDWYRRGLNKLYQELPEDKRIRQGTLSAWREKLAADNYSATTINQFIVAANGYLAFVGAREYQLVDKLQLEKAPQPELSRAEYLRLLSAARTLGRDKVYFLVKVYANTGLPVQETEKITVEAVTEGKIKASFGGMIQMVYIPDCICRELQAYAKREGILSGPILLTREGTPMSRTNISQSITALARHAGVAEEKCNPRCLKKLYQTARETMERNIAMLVEQAQIRALEEEQLSVGWVVE